MNIRTAIHQHEQLRREIARARFHHPDAPPPIKDAHRLLEYIWHKIVAAGYLPWIETGGGMMIWRAPNKRFLSAHGEHPRAEVKARFRRSLGLPSFSKRNS